MRAFICTVSPLRTSCADDVCTVRQAKLPSPSRLQTASQKFVKQQVEYMKLGRKRKSVRGSVVNFDETHELIKSMRDTFTSRRSTYVSMWAVLASVPSQSH